MVFIAKTSSPNEWKTVASTIQTLVEEATFTATPERLSFRAMDPSHVALVDLEWPNSAFEKYDCDKEFKFTVRVEDFVKLIRRADAKDSVEIASADNETILLRLANGYKREFQLHLIESVASSTPLPKLSFNSRFLMTESVFRRVLDDISAVSDHIMISAAKDGVKFNGKSDSGSATAELLKGSQDLLELEVKEESKATFSIDYLLNIAKAAGPGSDTTTFEYSTKMPLRLDFKLGSQGGRIHFYLAPRIEDK